jgi:uncharacterized membrane protein
MNLNQIKVENVISFSDAVFAFSITFMALSIQIPTFSSNISDNELTRRLGQLLVPNIFHYIVSFMVVGMYWISYHRIFEQIRRTMAKFAVLNVYRFSGIFYWASCYLWDSHNSCNIL